MVLPKTQERVPKQTSKQLNKQIRRETSNRIQYYTEHPSEISDRLAELDREWDIERTLEANASALILITLALSVIVNRKLLVFPAIIAGFLFQHALQGWCPPVPLLRRFGVRTAREIEVERQALQALERSP